MALTVEQAEALLRPLQQCPRVVSFCGIHAPGRAVTFVVNRDTDPTHPPGWCVIVSREGVNPRVVRAPTLPRALATMVRWLEAMTTPGSRLDLFLRMRWLRADEVSVFRAGLCRIRNEIGEDDEA